MFVGKMAEFHPEVSIFKRNENPRIFHRLNLTRDDHAATEAIEGLNDRKSRIDSAKKWLNWYGSYI